jgi:hypothetical protein
MYTLIPQTLRTERTSWWKDENHMEETVIWYLQGEGITRPATEFEIDLWQQKVEAERAWQNLNSRGRRGKQPR